jgi:uncharacterized cupredoxin-like copper-binding protein
MRTSRANIVEWRWLSGLALAAILVFTVSFAVACNDDDDDTNPPQNNPDIGTLNLRAVDFGFEVNGDLRPGPTRVVMPNEGQYLHYGLTFRVDDDRPIAEILDDFSALLSEDEIEGGGDFSSGWPDWATWYGGPGLVSAGERAELVIDFEPGRYVILCPIDDDPDDGVLHFNKGMYADVTIGGDPIDSDFPSADYEVRGMDDGTGQAYFFEGLPESVAAGETVFDFVNAGSELHEFILVRLPDGMSLEEAFEMEDPPIIGVGGSGPFEPGVRQQMRIDLAEGTYVFLCFLPNPEGIPHIEFGMVAPLFVQQE